MWLLFCFLVPFFEETIPEVHDQLEVTARQVRVSVVDEKGRPVEGLGAEDFQLKLNGHKLDGFTVSEFSFDDADEAELAAMPVRNKIIIFDTQGVRTDGWWTMRDAALVMLERLAPNERLQLFQMDAFLKELTPLTSDPAVVKQALEKVKLNSIEARFVVTANAIPTLYFKPLENSALASKKDTAITGKTKTRSLYKALYFLALQFGEGKGESVFYLMTGGYMPRQNDGDNHFMHQIIKHMNGMGIGLHHLLYSREDEVAGSADQDWAFGPRQAAFYAGGTFFRMDNYQAANVAPKLHRATGHYYLLTYQADSRVNYDKVIVRIAAQEGRYWKLVYPKRQLSESPFPEKVADW